MSPSIEIQLIAILVSVACAMSGTFLVLRKMSLMTDAITHTILFGIVVAYFITKDLNSPFLIVGAALVGVLTVWMTETVVKTHLVSEDSAIGLVFPLLFSFAIILVTKFADSVHLDVDSVLLGELAFAPFDRMVVFGVDIGPIAMWVGIALLVLNLLFITVFFRVLKVSTFDILLATTLGFSPVIIHYCFMTLVSITAVGAFQTAGSIMVIAFMIVPPATAYLLSNNLKVILVLSGVLGALSSILGFQLAHILDASIAGAIAVVAGAFFIIALIVSPSRGVLSVVMRRKRIKEEYNHFALLFHLHNHQNTPLEQTENYLPTLVDHFHWDEKKMLSILRKLQSKGELSIANGDIVRLTDLGKEHAKKAYFSFFGKDISLEN